MGHRVADRYNKPMRESAVSKPYTLVQHSGFGYAGDYTFRNAVESRMIETKREHDAVVKLGGLVFPSYAHAEDAAETINYPPGVEGLIPCVTGTFSDRKVDGLALYLPSKEDAHV